MKLLCCYIALCFTSSIGATIIHYPPTPNMVSGNSFIHPSVHYKIWCQQNGGLWEELFVYEMDARHYTNNSNTTAWVNFSFDGSARIRVERMNAAIDYAWILPAHAGAGISASGGVAEVQIDTAGQYSIEFENSRFITNPLLVFANAPEENIPDSTAANLIYFGPGLHQIGDKYVVPTGSTVYLHGGAYVQGQFYAEDGDHITIRGRGILSGEDYAARTADHMIHMRNCNNVRVDGITIIHAPRFMITLGGSHHYISNVKMMGWWFSTDGTSTGTDALIEHCFFKVNDDAIKLYQSRTVARHCVIWQMENGAVFQLGWNGNNDYGDCHVYDMDIIRVEHVWDNENEAVICAIHGGRGIKQNFLFEDIRITHSNWRIFHLVTRPNRWGNWDTNRGEMGNMIFRNITMQDAQSLPSLVMGHDAMHTVYNLVFEQIVTGGKSWTGARKEIIIDETTTQNIIVR